MLGFVSNFVGVSPVATDWDKTVAEIIHTPFVFLGHPREGGRTSLQRKREDQL